MVLDHLLSNADSFRDVGISQTLRDKVDESPLAFVQMTVDRTHQRLR
jgi:hypothetical protein